MFIVVKHVAGRVLTGQVSAMREKIGTDVQLCQRGLELPFPVRAVHVVALRKINGVRTSSPVSLVVFPPYARVRCERRCNTILSITLLHLRVCERLAVVIFGRDRRRKDFSQRR
jgi:hypothetical protein